MGHVIELETKTAERLKIDPEVPLEILVAESLPDRAGFILRSLAESSIIHFQTTLAGRLDECIDTLSRGGFDAVLLDLKLSDRAGAKILKSIVSRAGRTPVLALTDGSGIAHEWALFRSGAQDVINILNADPSSLVTAVVHAVERARVMPLLRARESDDPYRDLIETSPDPIIAVDENDHIIHANRAWNMALGFETHAGGEQSITSLIHPGRIGDWSRTKQKIILTGKPARVELSLVGRRGAEVMLEGILTPHRHAGESIILRGIFRDVTQQNAMRRFKDEFISTLSHEIRSPTTSIKGAIEVLRDGLLGPLTDSQAEYIDIAAANVTRLNHIINDVLDLSRLESGGPVPQRRAVGIEPLIREALEGIRLDAERRNIRLEVQLEPDLRHIYADPDMIAQVLDNLCSNAVRFARSTVIFRARRLADPEGTRHARLKRMAIICVEDDGEGIDPALIPGLFNKYVQIGRVNRKKGQKGTGLGLAICREIVRRHLGAIWAESESGKGSRFCFTLPEDSPAQNAAADLADVLQTPVVTATPHAMIILRFQHDEPDARAVRFMEENVLRRGADRCFAIGQNIVLLFESDVAGADAMRRRIADIDWRAGGCDPPVRDAVYTDLPAGLDRINSFLDDVL